MAKKCAKIYHKKAEPGSFSYGIKKRTFKMDILTYELKESSAPLLNTEVLFHIAAAKVKGVSLLRLIPRGGAMSRESAITKILRSQKKEGRLQLFIKSEDFTAQTTEAEYLENKYPDIKEYALHEVCYIIKL